MVGYCHKFNITIAKYILPGEQILIKMFCCWVSVHIYFWYPTEYLPSTRRLECILKAPCRHQYDFSIFSELHRCCTWDSAPLSVCKEHLFVLALSWVTLEVPWKLLSQKSIKSMHSFHWKSRLATTDRPLIIHIPQLLRVLSLESYE